MGEEEAGVEAGAGAGAEGEAGAATEAATEGATRASERLSTLQRVLSAKQQQHYKRPRSQPMERLPIMYIVKV